MIRICCDIADIHEPITIEHKFDKHKHVHMASEFMFYVFMKLLFFDLLKISHFFRDPNKYYIRYSFALNYRTNRKRLEVSIKKLKIIFVCVLEDYQL